MLFLVISDPRPERPSTVTAARQSYWTWIQPLIDKGEVRSVHAKVGRGAGIFRRRCAGIAGGRSRSGVHVARQRAGVLAGASRSAGVGKIGDARGRQRLRGAAARWRAAVEQQAQPRGEPGQTHGRTLR